MFKTIDLTVFSRNM